MEVYQWRLNTPGNSHGIVIASDDYSAIRAIREYAYSRLGENTNDIDLCWIGYNDAANPDIYVLTDM